MVELARQDPVAACVARQKHHLTASQFAREKGVGRIAKGSLHLHPLLPSEAFDGIKSTAADDADAMGSHEKRKRLRPERGLIQGAFGAGTSNWRARKAS